jgi:hypothetical protein
MRCKCCDEPFHPTIITDDDGKFVAFEDTCNNCVTASFQEENYVDIFGDRWVKSVDNYSSYSED